MKGLIKYELKKMISVWWLVYIAVMIFLFVTRPQKENYNYFAYVLVSTNIAKIACGTILTDEKSGWLALQGILPVSKRQYLTVKYIRCGIVTALNCCFIYTLIGIRCALNDNFDLLPFWLPILLHLSLSIAYAFLGPDSQGLKGGGLRMHLIRFGMTVFVAGILVLFLMLATNPAWESRLLPFVIGFLVFGAAVCVLNVKEKLDQFEGYQLGIPSELQREE